MTINILLTVWEGIQGVFGFILCMGVVFLIYIGVAKLMNITIINRSGDVVADPKTYENLKNTITSSTRQIIEKVKSRDPRVSKIMSENKNNKVGSLVKLGNLKRDGIISSEEFELLKKEILTS